MNWALGPEGTESTECVAGMTGVQMCRCRCAGKSAGKALKVRTEDTVLCTEGTDGTAGVAGAFSAGAFSAGAYRCAGVAQVHCILCLSVHLIPRSSTK
jgi:hypothetical protein